MHRVSLPAEFKAELRERRNGRDRIFGRLNLQKTAMLVIDMQNAFVAPGSPLEVPFARGIVANINYLAARMRNYDAPVIWVRTTFAAEGRASWPIYFDHFAPGTDAEALRASLYRGADGHAFWRELDVDDHDLVVDKDRFSAFIQGASALEVTLRDRGVDTLVITGTLTNVCCESTARDAMMLDFKCIMVEDANAAQSDEDHLAGLRTAARVFADVMTCNELLELIEAGPSDSAV